MLENCLSIQVDSVYSKYSVGGQYEVPKPTKVYEKAMNFVVGDSISGYDMLGVYLKEPEISRWNLNKSLKSVLIGTTVTSFLANPANGKESIFEIFKDKDRIIHRLGTFQPEDKKNCFLITEIHNRTSFEEFLISKSNCTQSDFDFFKDIKFY